MAAPSKLCSGPSAQPRSARGLFRATGKTSKPVAVLAENDLAGTIERAEHLPREEHDFYPTPPEPTLALAHNERHRLQKFPVIWEPACGDGAMMRDLAGCGLTVIGTDLIDRGCGAPLADFFGFDASTVPSRHVVTNPPFNLCNWRDGKGGWITHALEVLKLDYMALLLPWNWPGAGGLGPLWEKHPPARVYLMRWKIDFTGQGAPPMLNAWFVWDRCGRADAAGRNAQTGKEGTEQGEMPIGRTELLMMDRVHAQHAMMGQLFPPPCKQSTINEAPHGT